MSKEQLVEYDSLFGKFAPQKDFKPLIPLDQCKEEVLASIIENFLYENQYVVLSGDKDSYKSWLAAYIAVCVALGKDCFGRTTKQGKVVYIYGEGNMKRRLKRMCLAFGENNPTDIYPYSLRGDLSDKKIQEDVKKHIPAETKLIIIDNYEKFWGSDTSDEEVNEAMVFIRDLREKATVILVQHNRKNKGRGNSNFNKTRGSGKIVNNADGQFSIDRNKDIVNCDIYIRETEPLEPICFRLLDKEDGSIICEEVKPLDKDQEAKDCLAAVRRLLKSNMNEPINKTSIYNNILKGKGIKGLSADYFFNIIFNQLKNEGSLCEVEDGKYKFVNKSF